jgi:hypothetical protein
MAQAIKLPIRTIRRQCRFCEVERPFVDVTIHEGRLRRDEFRCRVCLRPERLWFSSWRGQESVQLLDLQPIWKDYHDLLLSLSKRAALTDENLLKAHCLEAMQLAAMKLGRSSWMEIRIGDVRRALESLETELAAVGLRNLTIDSALTVMSLIQDLQKSRPILIQVELGAALLTGNPAGIIAAVISALAPDRAKRAMTVYLIGRVGWVLMLPGTIQSDLKSPLT